MLYRNYKDLDEFYIHHWNVRRFDERIYTRRVNRLSAMIGLYFLGLTLLSFISGFSYEHLTFAQHIGIFSVGALSAGMISTAVMTAVGYALFGAVETFFSVFIPWLLGQRE